MADQNIKVTRSEQPVKVDNTPLIEAIKEMRENFTPETQNKVINAALRSTFLVPATIEDSTELVADNDNKVKFQDKKTAKFLLINHETRGSFFPVFTGPEELEKLKGKTNQNYTAFTMKFGDIAGLTENTPNVVGFVVNPFGHNLPFNKDMLQMIKQTLAKVRKEREEAAKAETASTEE